LKRTSTPPNRCSAADQRLDLIPIGDVGELEQATLGAEFGHRRGAQLGVHVGDHDRGAVRMETPGRGKTDAGGAAGHDGDLTCKAHQLASKVMRCAASGGFADFQASACAFVCST
jgi:hypothetical protein